jgi:DNA-binding transcriptional LysR family regulator
MDLRSLECFVAVAEEGSVSRAAVRLHMSQPPLSVRLQALERELGVPLLVRHGRGVDLTAPGRLLLERGRRLLAELDSTSAAVRAVGEGRQGRLSVAVGRSVSPALLGEVLSGVRTTAADLVVDVAELPDAELLDRVRAGTADVGLVHRGPDPREPRAGGDPDRGYERAVVARDQLVAVLPVDHPHASEERLDLATVGGRLVTVARRSSPALHAHAVAAWRATSATGELQEADSVTGVLALVRAGIGVALLPGCAAALAWEDLAALPLRQHTPPVDTVVAWRPQDDAPVVRRFLRVALSTPEPDVLGPDHARA